MSANASTRTFTRYQVFIIAILAILQFTLILDFMVLSPLSAILLDEMKITTSEFGMVVSAYAFSAGISGILAAGFADKFDRKKLLLFFYTGFLFGTFLCGIAPTYNFLLGARIVTGIFGGVIGSISFAIISDLFKMEVRGRVMGFVQMAFAASQVLGLPFGLYLANHYGWHSPFLLIVGLSVFVGLAIIFYMKPIDEHLKHPVKHNAFQHLLKTVSNPTYLRAFAATVLLATGGFMLMPFGSAYTVNNLGIPFDKLPIIYGITGLFTMVTGPFMGKLSDKFGKYLLFCIGSVLTIVMVGIYCNIGTTTLTIVVAINVILFIGVTTRMISATALMSAIPSPQDRGAFMSVNSSIQQISGGFASALAGVIVHQNATGKMENYPVLGYVVISSMLICALMMYVIDRHVAKKTKAASVPSATAGMESFEAEAAAVTVPE